MPARQPPPHPPASYRTLTCRCPPPCFSPIPAPQLPPGGRERDKTHREYRSWRGPARSPPASRRAREGPEGWGDGTGAPATLPWTGRAPRRGHGPGLSRRLASTGPTKLTVPPTDRKLGPDGAGAA